MFVLSNIENNNKLEAQTRGLSTHQRPSRDFCIILGWTIESLVCLILHITSSSSSEAADLPPTRLM